LLSDPGAIRAYDYFAQAEAATGDYERAYEYMRAYKRIDDEYWSYTSRAQTNELEAKYQSARNETRIADQELALQRRTSQRNTAMLMGLFISGMGLFWWIRQSQKNQLQKIQLENLKQEQQLLALDFMVQGQEEERKRIAQDLHDGLGGLLTSTQIQLRKVQAEIEKLQNLDFLKEANRMIDTACKEVRRISHDMMPGA
ncbi:MAG: histidine kinase, partial [Bacteroidota bacterium]